MSLRRLKASYWDKRLARHLLNRAGFGVPASRVEALADMGLDGAVDFLVNYDSLSAQLREPDWLVPLPDSAYRKERRGLSDVEKQMQNQERQKLEREAISRLQAWWFSRMWTTPRPLEEKLTLFWHGHFATSAQKVKSSTATYQLNQVLRKHAAGNLKQLTIDVGQSLSMLEYLDNRKSTKEHPNENWARELMELFTMGVGNYTEQDIKEAARAFTGWSNDDEGFEYKLSIHDNGEKTFLGQTGDIDGWKIIDIIYEQPVTAEFLCGKLWKFFIHEDINEEAVTALAQILRENNYELRPVLHELFRSAEFYSTRVRAQQVKSPVQYLLQLCDDLAISQPPFRELARGCRMLGQDLFYPPNVKGWDGNRAWINANSLLLRYNMPPELVKQSVYHAQMAAMKGERTMQRGDDGEENMMMQMMEAKDERTELREYVQAATEKMRDMTQEVLLEMTPREAKEIREQLKEATPEQKREILRELGVDLPEWETVDPTELFASMHFETAGACVDALTERFLLIRLASQQRTTVLALLGRAEGDPLLPEEVTPEQRRALLRLVTSMAEYQLC